MAVPLKKTLADIYPEDALASQTERWNRLLSSFRTKYGKLPDFVARSPGRVNLIGEVS
jgi:galactokinase